MQRGTESESNVSIWLGEDVLANDNIGAHDDLLWDLGQWGAGE